MPSQSLRFAARRLGGDRGSGGSGVGRRGAAFWALVTIDVVVVVKVEVAVQ